MSLIKSVALTEFSFDVPNIGLETAAAGVGNMAFVPGSTFTAKRWAVRLYDGDGVMGGYVTNWVGTPAAFGQASMLAPLLVGRDPAEREAIYNDLKWELRAYDHMGHGPLDIAIFRGKGRALRRDIRGAMAISAHRRHMTDMPQFASCLAS